MCSSLSSAQTEGAAVDGFLSCVEKVEACVWHANPREHLIDADERLDVGAKRAKKKKEKKNKPEKPQRHPARQVQSCRHAWVYNERSVGSRQRDSLLVNQQVMLGCHM